MKGILSEGLESTGLKLEDIEFKKSMASSETKESHFGNYVFTPALDNEATQKLAEHWKIKTDMHRFVLENSDIELFRVGDKVFLQFTNGWAGQSQDRGTVIKIERKTQEAIIFEPEKIVPGFDYYEITIRRHRSKNKGYRFVSGDEVKITRKDGGS